MGDGLFILHRFCGDEKFGFESAEVLANRFQDKILLKFEVYADKNPIETLPDTAELKAWPKAEVIVILDEDNFSDLVGRSFEVPEAYDEKFGDHVATIYYCEHEDLNENKIEVLERENNLFHIHWTGKTIDVNYYDGSMPDTQVEIDGWFKFKDLVQP